MTDKLPKPVFSKVETRFVFKLCSVCPILTLRSVFVQGKQEHILGLNYNTGDCDDGLALQHHYYLGENLDKFKHLLKMLAKGQQGPYSIGMFSDDDVMVQCRDREVSGYFRFHPFGIEKMHATKAFSPRKTDNIEVAVDQLLELISVIESRKAINEEHSEILGRVRSATGFFPQCNTRSTFNYYDVNWPAE